MFACQFKIVCNLDNLDDLDDLNDALPVIRLIRSSLRLLVLQFQKS